VPLKRAFFLFSLFCLSIGVISCTPKRIWSSPGKKPKWISYIPEEKGYHYFIGIAQNQPDRATALRKAIEEALKQVLTTIGVTIGTDMRIEKEIQASKVLTKMIDEYSEKGRAKLRGHKIKEIYSEEYFDGNRRFYDVYVLLRYSEREIAAERRRIEEEQRRNRATARFNMEDFKKLLNEGRVKDAVEKLFENVYILSDQPSCLEYKKSFERLKEILGNISLKPLKTTGRKPQILAVLNVEGRKIPYAFLDILAEFEQGEGEISSPEKTDENGIAEFEISKIKFQAGVAKINFIPEKTQFMETIKSAISDKQREVLENLISQAQISIVLKASDFGGKSVCILFWSEEGQRVMTFEVSLAEKLTEVGVNIKSFSNIPTGINFGNFEQDVFYKFLKEKGVDVLVVGKLKAIDNGNVYNLKSVTVNADYKIVEVKSKKITLSKTDSKTAVQINFDRAKAKALKGLAEIVSKSLQEILSIQ